MNDDERDIAASRERRAGVWADALCVIVFTLAGTTCYCMTCWAVAT